MSKKAYRKFSEEEKQKAVDDYTTGKKSAADVVKEFKIAVGQLYRWKADLEQKVAKGKIKELTDAGASLQMAKKIRQQEDEIEAYQKKVAEQSLIIDLLKKLQTSTNYQLESELTGLIGTMKNSARKQKPFRL